MIEYILLYLAFKCDPNQSLSVEIQSTKHSNIILAEKYAKQELNNKIWSKCQIKKKEFIYIYKGE